MDVLGACIIIAPKIGKIYFKCIKYIIWMFQSSRFILSFYFFYFSYLTIIDSLLSKNLDQQWILISSTNDFSTGNNKFLNLSTFLLHHYHHPPFYILSCFLICFSAPTFSLAFSAYAIHLCLWINVLPTFFTIYEYIDVQFYTLMIFCMHLLGILYVFLVIDRGRCHCNSALLLFSFWVISILNIFAVKTRSQNTIPFYD